MKKKYSTQSGFTMLQAIIAIAGIGLVIALGTLTFGNKTQSIRTAITTGEMVDLRRNLESQVSCEKTADLLKKCRATNSTLYDHFGRDLGKVDYRNIDIKIGCEDLGNKLWSFKIEAKNKERGKWKDLRNGIPLVCDVGLDQRCWFAVSGTWISHSSYRGKYQDTFPKTWGNKPISHGATFDNVGGVYLLARDEPYIYGKGDHEIDKAVNLTFDGILVAPGMHALIKNGAGKVMFDQEGPIVAGSSYYENQSKWKGKYHKSLLGRKDIPQWMQDYVHSHTNVAHMPLHAARSVKVSAVPGGICDSN
jgi:hypothetical protein